MNTRFLSFAFAVACVAATAVACAGTGGSGSDSDDEGQDAGASCTEMCSSPDATCPFSNIDCAAACANIQAVCASGCTSCDGVDTNASSCLLGCQGSSSAVSASNVAYGCYAQYDTCDAVGSCYLENCPAS